MDPREGAERILKLGLFELWGIPRREPLIGQAAAAEFVKAKMALMAELDRALTPAVHFIDRGLRRFPRLYRRLSK